MPADQRDDLSWVVLELTKTGEVRAEEGTLEAHLRDALDCEPEHPLFIPIASYLKGNTRVTLHLMEGYAFVATGLSEVEYLNLERDSIYVRKVLRTEGDYNMPVLSVLPNKAIEEMREKLSQEMSSDITKGMHIRVVSGPYRHLEGRVVAVEGEQADIQFDFRSMSLTKRLPKVFLEPTEEVA